jgi:uncharacterized protein
LSKTDQYPDFESAKEFVLDLLEERLAPDLTYHSIAHTRDEVVPAVERYMGMESIEGEQALLLLTAAWYHDTGFTVRYENHEKESVSIARKVLPGYGYSANQVKQISRLIQATKMPQSPSNNLERILADADLDILGSSDYMRRNLDLRRELAVYQQAIPLDEWYTLQLELLESHVYFTRKARLFRNPGKLHNRTEIQKIIDHQSRLSPEDGEKLVILKSVSIFSQTPPNQLEEVLPLLQECRFDPGETIIKKGELGTSMYIVASGRVEVRDEELVLNHLQRYDIFGEMAALDPEPRSASVSAVEETYLYRLNQPELYELIQSNSGVATGIIRVLSQRMRNRMRNALQDHEYIQQFTRVIAAASAVEAGIYEPEMLDEVAARKDDLGSLGRVFQDMVRSIGEREGFLKKQVSELRIQVDRQKQARQVAEITESEYFQELRRQVEGLRSSMSDRKSRDF